MLFLPKRTPNPKKYMLGSYSVHLTDSKNFIHGPFNYDAHTDIIKTKQHGVLTHWEFLISFCNQFSIVPPILSTLKLYERHNFLHDPLTLSGAFTLLLVISMNMFQAMSLNSSYYLMFQDKLILHYLTPQSKSQ